MQKILKVKQKEVRRNGNGTINLSAKVKNTCVEKGYRLVQIKGSVYKVAIKCAGITRGMRIAWVGDKVGYIDPRGKLIMDNM